MKKHYEIKDPKSPATRGQLFFLHILTGEDTRAWTITKGEAAKKIASLKKNGGKPAPAPAPVKQASKKAKATTKSPSKATEKAKKAPQKPAPSKDTGKAKKQSKSTSPKSRVEQAWESPETATARRLGAAVL